MSSDFVFLGVESENENWWDFFERLNLTMNIGWFLFEELKLRMRI